MAFRTVGQRLARDFWVRPSEAIIRRWHRAYAADIVLDDAYHAWIVARHTGATGASLSARAGSALRHSRTPAGLADG